MNEQLKKRVKSLLWKTGAMLVVGGIAIATDYLQEVGKPEIIVAMLGLIGSEITKYLNSSKR